MLCTHISLAAHEVLCLSITAAHESQFTSTPSTSGSVLAATVAIFQLCVGGV